MVVVAYTLVRTEDRKIGNLVSKMKKLRLVKEATPVYGEYNIVVKTETESIEELTFFIYKHLRTIPGLTMTTTMITAKIPKRRRKD